MYFPIILILFGSSISATLSDSSPSLSSSSPSPPLLPSPLPLSSSTTSSSYSHVILPGKVPPPQISVISHAVRGETVDIPAEDKLILRCVGDRPMIWVVPNNSNPQVPNDGTTEDYGSINITQNCDSTRPKVALSDRCKTEIVITEIKFSMTGQYTCQYNQTKSNALQFNFPNQTVSVTSINFHQPKENDSPVEESARSSIYIFVNDRQNLIVPYEGGTLFQFLALFQGQPATIPCKATISGAKVTLWKTQNKNHNFETEIRPDPKLGISFNPTKGFYFESPRWDQDTHVLECRFEYGEHVSTTMVTVHWSILQDRLLPLIDDSGAQNVYHNSTFTLKCFVHIEIGVIIVIDWDIPNQNKNNQTDKRFVKSDIETHRSTIDSQNYDTVSVNLTVHNALESDSGDYRCNVTDGKGRIFSIMKHVKVYDVLIPKIVNTNMENNVIKKEIHSPFELRCYVSGYPQPQLVWFRDGEQIDPQDDGLKIEDNGQKIVFGRLLEKHSGKYECRGHNRGGKVGKIAYLQVDDDDFASFTFSELIIYTLFFVLAVAILVISVFIGRKLHQDRLWKREMASFSQAMFENGQMEMFNPDMPLDEQIDLLPYDARYEFPKENLHLGRTLGQGAFGRVVKAEAFGLDPQEDPKIVAVKMLKERANSDHRKALMAELKILIHLGRHVNIVNLLGAVTRNIAKGELLVLVEYCEFGNLRDFLLANRDNFHNEIHPSCANGEYQNVSSSKNQLEYQNSWKNGTQMAFFNHNYVSGTASVALSNSSIKKTQKPLFSSDLICYSFQCSRGMEYLAQRKLIHRDLAARNVLLDSNYIVKICDFGLAKDVYKDDNYVKQNSGPLPIKWMAIESMTDKIFTSKSDVWSFGILLWEIFTLGKNPYPGIEINEEFYQKLKSGYRMEKPEYASDLLYELMLKCWDPSSTVRPDFEVISHIIGEMLPPERRQQFIDMNSTFEEMNQELLRNDYMKMASMTGDENGNCYDAKDASTLLNGANEDYLQMHDDKKVYVSNGSETICMDNLNNNQPYM